MPSSPTGPIGGGGYYPPVMKDWAYCPRCRGELERLGAAENPYARCAACGFEKYDNPLPTTIGIVHKGDEYLFLRRADEPCRGEWDTVGGFLGPGETAEECLVREAREELGCAVTDLVPVGTYASMYGPSRLPILGISFVCILAPGSRIRLSAENDAYRWFSRHQIPDLAFSDVRQAVRDVLVSR